MSGSFNMTIADVLNTDDFKDAQLLAGEAGINRIVTWVHILEIRQYVQESVNGGELILSTGVGFSASDDVCNFFRDLIKKNIAGLCFEIGTYITEIPQEIIQMAEDNDCPLIIFPKIVRFVDITRHIITRIINSDDLTLSTEKQRWGKNEWMGDWLKGELEEEVVCKFLGRSKKELINTHFFVIVLDMFLDDQHQQNRDEHLFNITTIARKLFEQRNFIMYALKMDSLLVWIIFDLGNIDTWKIKVRSFFEKLMTYNKILPKNTNITMGCGIRTRNVLEVSKSYKTALETINVQQKIKVDQPFFEDLHVYRLFSLIDLPEKGGQLKNYVIDYLGPIIDYDSRHSGSLMKTLQVFYQCNASKQKTAQQLAISRVTLYQRLEKIEELLGNDMLSHDKRLAIEFAIFMAESLFGKDNLQRKILDSIHPHM